MSLRERQLGEKPNRAISPGLRQRAGCLREQLNELPLKCKGADGDTQRGQATHACKVSGAHFLSSADNFRQYLTNFKGKNVVGNEFGRHNQKFQAQQ